MRIPKRNEIHFHKHLSKSNLILILKSLHSHPFLSAYIIQPLPVQKRRKEKKAKKWIIPNRWIPWTSVIHTIASKVRAAMGSRGDIEKDPSLRPKQEEEASLKQSLPMTAHAGLGRCCSCCLPTFLRQLLSTPLCSIPLHAAMLHPAPRRCAAVRRARD